MTSPTPQNLPDRTHPFITHLSYFASSQSSSTTSPPLVYLLHTLHRTLSLGLNFPLSCLYTLHLHYTFGNVPSSPSSSFFPSLNPLRPINPHLIPPSNYRTQLQDVPTGKTMAGTAPQRYDRAGLMSLVSGRSWADRMQVLGFWAVAADREGFVSAEDVEAFKRGDVLERVRERREWGRGPEVVVPFTRGGPGIVSAHSWFVDKLFGVKVYQKELKSLTES